MTKVLIITGILPITELKKKKDENDILLVIEKELINRYNDVSFEYLFVFPFANFALGKFSKKWLSYYKLGKKKQTKSKDKIINLLSLIMLPKRFWFRKFLYNFSFWLNRKYLDDLVLKIKPTIIHAQNIESDAYLARKIGQKYGIPYVVTLRSVGDRIDSFHSKNLNGAKSLVAVSPSQIRVSYPFHNNRITIIPHGISENFLSHERDYNINFTPLKLVLVARLLSYKNIDKVIIALSKIKKDFIFDIYGDGPEKAYLKNLVLDLKLSNKIFINGRVAHHTLPGILGKYHLFVLPSFPETFGRVYLEAMACGLPVMGSRNTGVEGIISHNREGFLVTPQTNDIEASLRKIFENPEQLVQMNKMALKLSKQFSWNVISEKYFHLYKKE